MQGFEYPNDDHTPPALGVLMEDGTISGWTQGPGFYLLLLGLGVCNSHSVLVSLY